MAIGSKNPNYVGPSLPLPVRQPKALPVAQNFQQLLTVEATKRAKQENLQRSPVIPATPANFLATPTPGGVRLTWGAVTAPGVDGYEILKSLIGDFSDTVVIRINNPKQTSYFDPMNAGHSVVTYYQLRATAGTDNAPHSVLGTPTTTLATSSLNATTGFGKQILANPGFEMNTIGTALSNTAVGLINLLTLSGSVSDGWQVLSLNGNSYPTNPQGGGNPNVFSVMLESGNVPRTGDKNLLIRVNPNITIPASSPFYETRVVGGKIPVKNGDIIRVTAFERWDFSGAIPAGLTIIQRIGIMMFDKNDSFISELNTDISNTQSATWAQKQGAVQINVANVAYVRVQCSAFLQNSTGSPVSTSANFIADLRWDDLSFVYQNTAFDLTPLNTAYLATTNGNLLSQSGTTATVNVAAFTMQYGDGSVSYNSGTVTAPANNATGYVYCLDPTYSGGAVTYQWSTTAVNQLAQGNGLITIGKITLSAGGGGTGGAGGGGTLQGTCFTPDTLIVTKRGNVQFREVMMDDEVMTLRGWRKIKSILVHQIDGEVLQHMGDGQLVTSKHKIWDGKDWKDACEIWPDRMFYVGPVMNLHVDSEVEEELNYQLANGAFAHNFQKG